MRDASFLDWIGILISLNPFISIPLFSTVLFLMVYFVGKQPNTNKKVDDRTGRRVQMFVDKGIFKNKTEVISAAVELLVKNQIEIDSRRQAEDYTADENTAKLQKKEK
jgi:Arc/MetJ-type ribon-helix-helix transcriptional regulator